MASVNRWLDRLPAWQFALVYGGCIELAFVIAGSFSAIRGHLGLTFVLLYGIIFTSATTSAAVWGRQRRHRRALNKRTKADDAAVETGHGIWPQRQPSQATRTSQESSGCPGEGQSRTGGE